MTLTQNDLIRRFHDAGQSLVFRWWDEIGADGRDRLAGQLAQVDLAQLAELVQKAKAGELGAKSAGAIRQPAYIPLPRTPEAHARRGAARRTGEELLAAGRVGVVTVAGGEGTRLGYPHPKGMFPIGPVTGKSLFQIHAERILARSRRHGRPIPWYIMTSAATDAPIRDFFREKRCFGLPCDEVQFFRQRSLPAVDKDGRLVLVAKDRILLSPGGHGETFRALADNGMLDDMQRRGVEELCYFQVDNPLALAPDPVFLGFHRQAAAQMSAKAIFKRDPDEPLGAFVVTEGRVTVIEYSDLTPEEKRLTAPDGRLLYGLGSPAMHCLNVAFCRRMTEGESRLPLHLARKAQSCLDDSGRLVVPEKGEKNVLKFESFIFDAFQAAERYVILEVRREEEFSPLKNQCGDDSCQTCRNDLIELHARRLAAAGAVTPRDRQGRVRHPVEISPLFALDREELARNLPECLRLDEPVYLVQRDDMEVHSRLTVAVIHCGLRGYPEQCLGALAEQTVGAETILVCPEDADVEALRQEFPRMRVLRGPVGADMAAGKNAAIAAASGSILLLVASDMIARPNAVARLAQAVEASPRPVVVSAQLLLENGRSRRTAYPFPSVLSELNPVMPIKRLFHRLTTKGMRPAAGHVNEVEAIQMRFAAARTETFRKVGQFESGRRFGFDDFCWCARAQKLGVARLVEWNAQAHQIAPQLFGSIPPDAAVAMEIERFRLARLSGGPGHAALFRATRRAKALFTWLPASAFSKLIGEREPGLLSVAERGRRILFLRDSDRQPLEPEIESHIRWEWYV